MYEEMSEVIENVENLEGALNFDNPTDLCEDLQFFCHYNKREASLAAADILQNS